MKICGVVVLYNPDEQIYNNICSYIDFLDELIIFDNSSSEYKQLDKIKEKIKVKYITYHENKGIAFALKESLNYAIDNSYDWCLTMDQDSSIKLDKKKINDIKNILKSNSDSGIISFDYNNNSNKKLRKVTNWITSGNIINVKKYKLIDGFDEKLFIDFVDFDLCNQFYKKKIDIYVMNHSINHNIGNPLTKKIFGIKISAMNHSPIRYYYRYRNCVYLYKNDKKYYFKKLIYEFFINLFKMFLVENNKKEKIRMIKKGIKDAKNNKLGQIE